MLDAIQKADVLIEALGWIRQFRGKITVIKVGGSLLEDEDALRHMLMDIVFMETVGMWPVIVHGAGAAISREMQRAGIEPHFVQGRRCTDEQSLAIVEKVLSDQTNDHLTQKIEELGGRSMNLNFRSENVLFGQRLRLAQPDGTLIDLGFVGSVTRVDRSTIENICYAGQIPVIPSMCLEEETGQKLNVNADTAATAVAQALGAEKLVFLSDVNGVRANQGDPDSLIGSLTPNSARQMIADGTIERGMIPKVEAGIETLERGVGKIHIIDGRLRHSLLIEIYTTTGVGTQIVPDGDSN